MNEYITTNCRDHARLETELLKLANHPNIKDLFAFHLTQPVVRVGYGFCVFGDLIVEGDAHNMTILVPFSYPIEAPTAFFSTNQGPTLGRILEDEEKEKKEVVHRQGEPICFVDDKWNCIDDLRDFLVKVGTCIWDT